MALSLSVVILGTSSASVSAAACTAPATDYGSATYSTLNIPAAGTYKVYSRLQAGASAGDNSYLLEIDGNTCFVVGDTGTFTNWTWVDYRDANTGSKITHNFTAGNHTVKMIGREASVKLDRLIFTADMNCVPSGTGDNCATPPDSTNPVINITSPTNGQNVSNTITVSATASDDVGVTKVEWLIDGWPSGEDTTAPYSAPLDTLLLSAGQHTVSAKAFDAAGNNTLSGVVTVNVQNAPQFSCTGSTATICEAFATTPGTFTFTGGAWASAQGKLRLTNAATTGQTTGNENLAMHNTNVANNWDLTVEGKAISSNNAFDDFSVVFNYQNATNYYFASFNESNDGNTNGIFRIVNGVQTELVDFATTITPGTAYDIKVARRGNVYEVFRDDQKVGTATDAAFTSGKVGLGSRNNEVEFDNLVVTPVLTAPAGDATKPTVSVTSPTAGSTISSAIDFSANAQDNVGVTKVEFFVDDQLVGADSSAPFVFPLDPASLSNASHKFTAKAFDAANNSQLSAAVSATVSVQNFESGDINRDGTVNVFDLAVLVGKFGQSGGDLGRSDINRDGTVNVFDLAVLVGQMND